MNFFCNKIFVYRSKIRVLSFFSIFYVLCLLKNYWDYFKKNIKVFVVFTSFVRILYFSRSAILEFLEVCFSENKEHIVFQNSFLSARDHQQITFTTLDIFCQLSKNPAAPLVLADNIKMGGISTKIKWKIHTCLHCISSFEGPSSYEKVYEKKLPDYQFFYSLLFYITRFTNF